MDKRTVRVYLNVTSVAFAPDGQSILTGSQDGTARLWDTNYLDFVAYACTRVFRDFMFDERPEFSIFDDEPTCPQFVAVNTKVTTPLPPTQTPIHTATIPG